MRTGTDVPQGWADDLDAFSNPGARVNRGGCANRP
jgi:hypothetical protein